MPDQNSLRVYLAGPMAAVTEGIANDWRDRATITLTNAGIIVLSPMRETAHLFKGRKKDKTIGVDIEAYKAAPEERAGIMKGIVLRDRYDVKHSDIVLVNMRDIGVAYTPNPQDIPSVGTDCEMAWAFEYDKPIIMVAKKDSYYRKHPFPTVMVTRYFEELESACSYIIKDYSPYIKEVAGEAQL